MRVKMSPRVFLVAAYVVLFSVTLVFLISCGGGGGGGGGDGGGESINYSGSTGMAVIAADNAVELTVGGYYGGPTTTISTFGMAVVANDNAEASRQSSMFPFSWPYMTWVDKLTISDSVTSAQLAIQTATDTIVGNCGGSMTMTLNVDDTNGNFTGTIQNNSYCEDNVTMSGQINVSGVADLVTAEITHMEMSFTSLTLSSVSGSATMSGSVSTNFTPPSLGMTLNYLLRDNASNKVYKIENYVVTSVEGLDWVEMTFSSGRYYHPDYGYVEVASVDPFMQYVNDFGPSMGELTLTGGTLTKSSLVTLTTNSFEVIADTNGDGTFEWGSGIQNWSTENSTPVANSGLDQAVTSGSIVQLDGSSSFDNDSNTLSFSWMFQSWPAGSNAALDDPQVVNPTFVADVDGVYVLDLIVNDGLVDSAVDQVTVTAQKDIGMLSFQVHDAEYSKQLDRVIMASTTPVNSLHIYNPLTSSDTAVDLPLAPSSVSVAPDGLYAAVGHNGWISYVNLSTATLEKTFPVSTDVLDIVLAGNGYVYAFPRRDQWEYIRCVNIATEAETLSSGMQIYAGTLAKLHPDGTTIYGADNGLSPSDIEKYDISSGTADYLYDSPYHGDYPMCGDLWLSEDGLRIFTKCGSVFRSSTVQNEDMVYNGSLSNSSRIEYLSHSAMANKVIAFPEASVWPVAGMEDTELNIYDYDFLTFEAAVPMPVFFVGGQSYAAHGKYVFFSADGNNYFAIVQADVTAGLLDDFGIVVY
jgi:hypothetical protein